MCRSSPSVDTHTTSLSTQHHESLRTLSCSSASLLLSCTSATSDATRCLTLMPWSLPLASLNPPVPLVRLQMCAHTLPHQLDSLIPLNLTPLNLPQTPLAHQCPRVLPHVDPRALCLTLMPPHPPPPRPPHPLTAPAHLVPLLCQLVAVLHQPQPQRAALHLCPGPSHWPA